MGGEELATSLILCKSPRGFRQTDTFRCALLSSPLRTMGILSEDSISVPVRGLGTEIFHQKSQLLRIRPLATLCHTLRGSLSSEEAAWETNPGTQNTPTTAV